VILCRFERGVTVPRVNRPDLGPHRDTDFYPVFGPTVIGTNEQVHHILGTRAITIAMPHSGRAFENDITPQAGRELRERLVAFRARNLCKGLPCTPKPARGRLGDIARPLLQMVRLVKPGREGRLAGLISELSRERGNERSESLEADILRAMLARIDEQEEGTLPVRVIVEAVNDARGSGGALTSQLIGKRIRELGFRAGTRAAAGARVAVDMDKLAQVCAEYGVQETAHSAHSTLGNVPNCGRSAECAVSAESTAPMAPYQRWDPWHAPDEWSDELKDAYEERVAVMVEDGGISEDTAHRLAIQSVMASYIDS
jgi:hypothetical protein